MARRSAHQQRVTEFMLRAGQRVPVKPSELTPEERVLRAKLMLEEMLELIQEGLGVSVEMENSFVDFAKLSFHPDKPFDMLLVIDGFCDVLVTTTGTLCACGLADEDFLEEVDQNNLLKFGSGGYRNEHGKWIKPPGHPKPNLQRVLESQME